MKNLFLLLFLIGVEVSAQNQNFQNSAMRQLYNLANTENRLTLGGYGEVNFNGYNGKSNQIDVKRLVLLFAYKFDDRVQFVTEVEYEHVKEVYVEQAFLNYAINTNVNIRAGLMLVPMGIINEYHEATTFNGVERPSLDGKIIPTTWREIGIGVSGKSNELSFRYQLYAMNGFVSFNEGYVLRGTDGLRKGRQKGAESVNSDINLSAKIEYYGLPNIRFGLAAYMGKTQTTEIDNPVTQVGLTMLGADYRYIKGRFSSRGQWAQSSLKDVAAYNAAGNTDLGSQMGGYYLEAAYNLLPLTNRQRLDFFVRYEDFDTHKKTEGTLEANAGFHRKETTTGFSYHIAPGAVFKADYQHKKTAAPIDAVAQFNVGVGFFF
ncbi:MAG: hypothetical protein ISP74_02195 [Bacteroidia bacterium]|nr:hypothetical protein [Bacteroidia bacterium]